MNKLLRVGAWPSEKTTCRAALILATTFAFVLMLIGTTRHFGFNDDGARYLLTGYALWGGLGPRAVWLLDTPFILVQPLGWPLVLGFPVRLVVSVWGLEAGVVMGRVLSALLWLAAGLVAYRLSRRFVWCGFAVGVAVFTLMSGEGFRAAVDINSEPLYVLLTLLLIDRLTRASETDTVVTKRDLWFIVALACGAFWVRTVGLAAMVASVPVLWRRWRPGLVVLAIGFLSWLAYEWLNGSGLVTVTQLVTYSDALRFENPLAADSAALSILGSLRRVLGNLYSYAAWWSPLVLLPLPLFWGTRAILLVFYVTLVYGAVVVALRYRRQAVPLGLYTLTYVAIISSALAFGRYLLPLVPIAGLLAAIALQGLLGHRSGTTKRVAAVAFSVMALLVHMPQAMDQAGKGIRARSEQSGWPHRPEYRPWFEAADWLAAQSADDAVVVVRSRASFYLNSGRRAIDLGDELSGEAMCTRLNQIAVKRPVYLIELDHDDQEWGLVAVMPRIRSGCAERLEDVDTGIVGAGVIRFVPSTVVDGGSGGQADEVERV